MNVPMLRTNQGWERILDVEQLSKWQISRELFGNQLVALTSKENVIGMTIDRFRDIIVTQGNVEGFAILTVDSR